MISQRDAVAIKSANDISFRDLIRSMFLILAIGTKNMAPSTDGHRLLVKLFKFFFFFLIGFGTECGERACEIFVNVACIAVTCFPACLIF